MAIVYKHLCIDQAISDKEIFHMIRYIIVRCHTILNASNSVQYFGSMYYPAKYPNRQDCQWEIHPSIGYYVIVTFEDFQLQNPRYCTENSFYYYSHDYVELLENKRSIARLCWTDGLEKTYRTFTSKMLIKFHSNYEKRYRGFKASYKQGVCNLYSSILPVCCVCHSL